MLPPKHERGGTLAAPLATSLARFSSLGIQFRYWARMRRDVRVVRIAGSGVVPGPLHPVGEAPAGHLARKAAPRVTTAEKSSRAGFEVWVLGTVERRVVGRGRGRCVRVPVNRTVAEPPVLVAGLLHAVGVGHRSARVDREGVVGSALEDHRARDQVRRRNGRPEPADVARRRQVGVALEGGASAFGPHCSYAAAMFLPVSSDEGHDGIPARFSAMSSSNQVHAGRLAGRRAELRANANAQADVLVRRSDPAGATRWSDRPAGIAPRGGREGTGRDNRRRGGGARREGDQAHPESRGRSQECRDTSPSPHLWISSLYAGRLSSHPSYPCRGATRKSCLDQAPNARGAA